MDLEDHAAIEKAFHEAVTMTPATLEAWLKRNESRQVDYTHEGEKDSVGHHAGDRIVAIKRKKKAELSDDDYAWMRKVVGYVHRHLAQKPKGDIADAKWRYSLVNWGHGPVKD